MSTVEGTGVTSAFTRDYCGAAVIFYGLLLKHVPFCPESYPTREIWPLLGFHNAVFVFEKSPHLTGQSLVQPTYPI